MDEISGLGNSCSTVAILGSSLTGSNSTHKIRNSKFEIQDSLACGHGWHGRLGCDGTASFRITRGTHVIHTIVGDDSRLRVERPCRLGFVARWAITLERPNLRM